MEATIEKPRVFLAMPAYGLVHAAAMDGFYDCTRGAVECACGRIYNSSLLPMTFNLALASALEARDAGVATHFAMLHSDIEPQRGWLDTLWAEMRAHDADLVSAIVPIKAGDDSTSTAFGSTIDPWTVTRYVLRSERANLPTTFGREMAGSGEVLLVNTGCWLADLRRPWWDGFAFQLHSRMTRDADGRYVPQCRPEDWEMSRHLHAAGAKVMATWAVELLHHGHAAWASHVAVAPPAAA